MFYDTGSSSMDYSNRMTSLCGICFPGDVVPWLLAGMWRNPDRNEHTKGSDTPLWDSGEERHRGELANWHRNDTETRQSDRGIVYPIADTSGDFRRLYGCNFAENRPETIHENGRKRNMPRMSKKRKHELSFYLNDRGRVTYNELCRKCQHGCRQSFRAVVIDCPRYLSKRAKKKEEHTEWILNLWR